MSNPLAKSAYFLRSRKSYLFYDFVNKFIKLPDVSSFRDNVEIMPCREFQHNASHLIKT